jgi:hypothetical protein
VILDKQTLYLDDRVFVNIGALNRQTGSLQGRIDALEKELAAMKRAR